ncbi:MAG: Murein DD-endopeptidase MepM [Pelotomaculum sp. PtaB.Bin013]|nr:MAG: Murein DD-endopeptidase MepM [Pelotomaculum sp. PtaB.Bin013]
MPRFIGGLRRLPELGESINGFKRWLSNQSVACRIGMGVALYFILAFAAYALLGENACAVAVDGKVVAVVADKSDAKEALNELVRLKSDQAGASLMIGEKVSYNGIRVKEGEILDREALKDILNKTLSFNLKGVAIVINGETKLCLKKIDDARKLLDWLKSVYPAGPDEQVGFKEKVELVEKPVCTSDLLEFEAAKDVVLLGTSQIQQYMVKDGDTAWDISAKFDIFPEQLQATNPGVDISELSIGQVLKLSKEVPLLTVVATRQETVEEEIPYQVEEEMDDSLLSGEKKVVKSGVPGQRIATYLITRENGLETDRKICQQNIISQPSNEIVVRGSQTLLASRGGSARVSWPCGGGIVSPFGMRGGAMHEGIDIGADYGDSVAAAAGGTVISAGWDGGYGKAVVVSHGGGVATRYAHLSTISVAVGQSVDRGELIGLVGSTGNSTGPHLHFEVIVDGQQRNPVNFLQ